MSTEDRFINNILVELGKKVPEQETSKIQVEVQVKHTRKHYIFLVVLSTVSVLLLLIFKELIRKWGFF